jgi:hypothetical protein
MKTEERIGRNDPCPCGSGKKFKACCAGRVDAAGVAVRSGGTPWTAIVLAVVALAGVAAIALRPATPGATGAGAEPLSGGAQPGPAPAGKVWSAEHGHWHDAPQGAPGTGAPGVAPSAAPGAPIAQPGPAPEGQVWSAEHGHFHDAATGQVPNPAPPPAPVPTENTPPPPQ